MKQLTVLMTLAPAAAFAHGGHPPVPEASHGAVHTVPLVIAALIAVGGLVWLWKARS